MITSELIERIEGEALIDFKTSSKGTIEEANIRFAHYRGMETILEGRPALDALVIAPRVCGICGHSHLIAAVRMLEAIYRSSGIDIPLSPKALHIRSLTLLCELLQNHLKWLYLIMLPESAKLLQKQSDLSLKALYCASQANRLAALFSGQWPHSSYALPGGVTCDPTYIEVVQANKILSEIEQFVESEVLGSSLERYDALLAPDALFGMKGDFGTLLRNVEEARLSEAGRSYGRFLVLGEFQGCENLSMENGLRMRAEAGRVHESPPYAPNGYTYAKNALYDGKFYETGPLARSLIAGNRRVESIYAEFGDSALTRIVARVDEITGLLRSLRSILGQLDLDIPSFVHPAAIETISGEGTGIVEAPRGSLIHRARLENGKIKEYSIITPTQWNLGNGSPQNPGIAQKAMIGSADRERAAFIFRTFDVCSVCTTH